MLATESPIEISHAAKTGFESTINIDPTLISLLLSALLNYFAGWMARFLPDSHMLLQGSNAILSFTIVTALFALIYKWIPDTKISRMDVWPGALLTAALFNPGK